MMNKAEYTESDWLIVDRHDTKGITKVFKKDNLQDVLAFSKHVMEIIEQEGFSGSAMMQLNGFECVVSIRARSTDISDAELRLAELINKALEA